MKGIVVTEFISLNSGKKNIKQATTTPSPIWFISLYLATNMVNLGKEPETAPAPAPEASEQRAVPAAATTTASAFEEPADILPASHWAQIPVGDFPY